MNLYITATGRFVGTQAEAKQDGKGWKLEQVPTLHKADMIAYLNARQAAPPPAPAPIEVEIEQSSADFDPAIEPGDNDHRYSYQTPFSARTILADIDGSQIAKAIAQLHGKALAKIAAATIERMARLAENLA